MTVNSVAASILRKAAVNKDCKVIMVKIPLDQYVEVKKKQARMIEKAADNGDTSNVTMNMLVLAALIAFRVE